MCGKYGINTYFRGNRTIKNILVLQSTRTPCNAKVVLYTHIDVKGLTAMRNIFGNLLEHLGKDTRYTSRHSPQYMATKKTLASKPPWQLQQICREGQGFTWTIKESISIKVNNPILNRNIGKHNLPHICDGVLNTPELQINQQSELPTHKQACRISLAPPGISRSYISTDINNIPQIRRI